MQSYKNIDEYIECFPPDIRKKLNEMRELIRKSAPGSMEKISYSMPAFYLNGILVYFAAYKTHIGFYPTASGIREFKDELSAYRTSKGTVRFPADKPLPGTIIKKIVEFRVRENSEKKKRGKKIPGTN